MHLPPYQPSSLYFTLLSSPSHTHYFSLSLSLSFSFSLPLSLPLNISLFLFIFLFVSDALFLSQHLLSSSSSGGQRRRRDGPTSEQIDEVTAMFGEDYGDLDDDEEEEEEGTYYIACHRKIECAKKIATVLLFVRMCINTYSSLTRSFLYLALLSLPLPYMSVYCQIKSSENIYIRKLFVYMVNSPLQFCLRRARS